MEDREFTERYTIHRMVEQEFVTTFNCGDEDLNGFILTDAPLYRKEKLAVTYTVFEKSNRDNVIAFFSLSNDRISISDFDNKTRYNRFITVDAYAAAIPFYLRNGFVPLNDEDADEPTRLLYFDLNDLDED